MKLKNMVVKSCVFIIIFFLILLGITLLWVFNIAFKMIRDSYKESKELEKMSLEEYAKRRSERTSKVSDLNECVKQAVKKSKGGVK